MKSMTGFGAGEARAGRLRLRVELTSVNSRKGLDLQISLPREMAAFESEARARLQEMMSRGRLTLEARLQSAPTAGRAPLTIDLPRLKACARQCREAARVAGVETVLSLEFLLRLPGVMADAAPTVPPPELTRAWHAALDQAMATFDKARCREGAFLCRDLRAKFAAIERLARAVTARKSRHTTAYREALTRRLREAGIEITVDPERLARELALFADRSDVSEELTRLAAHLEEARRLLATRGAIGRNLDFLLQEIGREINTIGSKANDLEITRRVLAMKTELEKIREQAQNLE